MATCIKTGANVHLLTHNVILRADVHVHGHSVLVTGFNLEHSRFYEDALKGAIDFVIVADDYYMHNGVIVLKSSQDITVADPMRETLEPYGYQFKDGNIKLPHNNE